MRATVERPGAGPGSGIWNHGGVLERYLADLERLRSRLDRVESCELAVAVVEDRWRSRSAGREATVHLYRVASPSRRDRSAWSFAVADDVPIPAGTCGLGTVHGTLEPGAAIAVTLDGVLLMPVGPLRPLMRGVRWPGAT